MKEVIDFQQYLDEDGLLSDVSDEQLAFAMFLTVIVESASTNYSFPLSFAATDCQNFIGHESCMGEIEVWIFADSNYIGWECVECAETGVICNWEGTRWDKRDTTIH